MDIEKCYKCDGEINIYPQEGGFREDLTAYYAHCKNCGTIEEYLGSDGTKRKAIREYNAVAREKK